MFFSQVAERLSLRAMSSLLNKQMNKLTGEQTSRCLLYNGECRESYGLCKLSVGGAK